jgi:hypothetical protein
MHYEHTINKTEELKATWNYLEKTRRLNSPKLRKGSEGSENGFTT